MQTMWLSTNEHARLVKQTADWTMDQLVAITQVIANTLSWGDVQSAIQHMEKIAQL